MLLLAALYNFVGNTIFNLSYRNRYWTFIFIQKWQNDF